MTAAPLDDKAEAFLRANHAAAMVTLRADGSPNAVRIGLALVDGKLWSSGTQERRRTRFLRRDPRCTLFVFPTGGGYEYLGVDTKVTILEGDDVPELSIALFQAMQPDAKPGMLTWMGTEMSHDDFRQAMRDDHRLIYQFEVERSYGIY